MNLEHVELYYETKTIESHILKWIYAAWGIKKGNKYKYDCKAFLPHRAMMEICKYMTAFTSNIT
jgi:hypothetical protein